MKKEENPSIILFKCRTFFLEVSSSYILLANDLLLDDFHHTLPLENNLSLDLNDTRTTTFVG